MRGTIFRVIGLAAGAMLLIGLGISANASAHMFRSVGGTGIHHEATGERTESPEASDKPEATKPPKPAQTADTDGEAGPDEDGDHQTGATDEHQSGSQTEDKSGDNEKDKGGSGGGSGGGD